jgi:Peptidase inhibitor family I36
VSRRIGATVVAAIAAATLVGMIGRPAQARSYDGLCESSEVCLYWGYDYQGGVADFENTIYNYKSFYFKGHGPGAGSALNDNAASVRSKARFEKVEMCTDSYFRGKCFDLGPGGEVPELAPAFANELSSHFWHR